MKSTDSLPRVSPMFNPTTRKRNSSGSVAKARVRISDSFFQLEPVVNLLADGNPSVRIRGIRTLHAIPNPTVVCKLRALLLDPDERVQQEARKKLKPIEMRYRRKFFLYQNLLQKDPGCPAYKLGFAITSLRYAQIWVENPKLREYFLHQALKHLNQLIRMFDPRLHYFYYRAQVFTELGHERLAVTDYKHILSHKDDHLGAILALIDLYLKIEKPDRAHTLIAKLRNRHLSEKYSSALHFWLSRGQKVTREVGID